MRSAAVDWGGAFRLGGTLSRAAFRVLEGIGSARLDAHDAAPAIARRKRAAALRAVLAELCRIHRIDTVLRGRIPEAPAVLVANHSSYLDPMVLAGLVPAAPIAKREVADWPVIGSGARSLGVLFVDRSDPFSGAAVLREALRCLEAGVHVLCFPEGTTTTGETLLPFHRGLFGAARLAGVPIVPIALGYEDPSLCWVGDDDFLPHYLRTTARHRTGAHVSIGAPIEARACSTAEALAIEAHWRINDLLAGSCR
ncbi:lysophospholipid acyltransferase family protein [Vulgatibacter sp.]|uniref:lysophospholipid acyltransferase family protein n=1 Tax=Vulgatibacter sp. TaxID=1971226 RepID=UPI003569C430